MLMYYLSKKPLCATQLQRYAVSVHMRNVVYRVSVILIHLYVPQFKLAVLIRTNPLDTYGHCAIVIR